MPRLCIHKSLDKLMRREIRRTDVQVRVLVENVKNSRVRQPACYTVKMEREVQKMIRNVGRARS